MQVIERNLQIATEDGTMETYVACPERGSHPVIIFYIDAYGVRDELRSMVRRIASCGYYVMLPNLYHRVGEFELGSIPEPDDFERIARLRKCVESLTSSSVMADTTALLSAAGRDPGADATRVGTLGYCMSGRFAIFAATRFPDSVRCAASIHGTGLVSDEADSLHHSLGSATGELYFACAEHDRWVPHDMIEKLINATARDGINAEVEIYPGTEHGFVFRDRDAYSRVADDRHWERLITLFRRSLG